MKIQPVQRPVTPALFWVSMVLTGLCVAFIVWLVLGNVPLGAFGVMARVLLLVLLAVFVIASLAVTEVIPWRSRSWADWRRPKVLGSVIYLLLAAAAFVAGIGNVFNPPAADQATQLAIKNQTEQIAGAVGAGRISRIRQHIAGTWGEAGCAVSYRLALTDAALTMVSQRSPAGLEPYSAEYTVTADGDRPGPAGERLSVIEAREEHGWFPGFGVTFTYRSNGSSESLVWDHRKMNVNAVELVRCPEA